MNIMDGMDAARFRSGNPDKKASDKKKSTEKSSMPMVLRNLNNK